MPLKRARRKACGFDSHRGYLEEIAIHIMKKLFTLRCNMSDGLVVIHTYDPGVIDKSHTRIDATLIWNGKTIFPVGATWCSIPNGTDLRGITSKELVLSLFEMRPGDTDSEYFDSYTPEQLEWAIKHGEELGMIRDQRYCDPRTGACRRDR